MVPLDRRSNSQEVDAFVRQHEHSAGSYHHGSRPLPLAEAPKVDDIVLFAAMHCHHMARSSAIQVKDDNVRERMLKETGRTTCPPMVVGEVIVGELEETAAADRAGELRRLVATT
jgi:hypothetical protein